MEQLDGGPGGRPFRTSVETDVASDLGLSVQNVSVAHDDRGAARVPYGLQHQVVANGRGDPNAGGDRGGARPWLGVVGAVLERPDERRAPGGLDDHDLRPGRADPPKLLELVEGLRHANDAGAAAGWKDDHVGQGVEAPAAFFGQLEPDGLLP